MNVLRRYRFSRDPGVTVANLVDELLRRSGDCEVGVEESGPWRLAELHAEVCALDAFLRRTVGLRPGQPVAIYRSNDRRCFRWFLAVIRAGGVAVPLNPQLTLTEVQRILLSSGTEILVTDKATFERQIGGRPALAVRTWIQADADPDTMDGFLRPPPSGTSGTELFPPRTIDPAATVAVFHTSGTTGFPKGAALSSTALLGARASAVLAGLILGPSDLALVALPWSHIMAVSIALYGLMAGIRGCFLDRFDSGRALDLVERFGITAVVGVPAMLARLINSNPRPERLRTVRVWLSASDHLPPEIARSLRRYGAFARLPGGKRIPPVLLNGYGMAELGGLAMMGVELSFLPGSGDFYFPVPPFQARIAGKDGRPVPAGTVGECQLRRRGLTPHYWKDEAGAQTLLTRDNWMPTGDLAVRTRFGLIRLAGRMKDVIKSGGYSVYLLELETAILAHPAVARAAGFGLPHREKGENPVAAVELRDGCEASEEELLAWCRLRLAGYKAPHRIWILAPGGLPETHTGKVMRHVLRERFSDSPGPASAPEKSNKAVSPSEAGGLE